jgi:hypothetical protein
MGQECEAPTHHARNRDATAPFPSSAPMASRSKLASSCMCISLPKRIFPRNRHPTVMSCQYCSGEREAHILSVWECATLRTLE